MKRKRGSIKFSRQYLQNNIDHINSYICIKKKEKNLDDTENAFLLGFYYGQLDIYEYIYADIFNEMYVSKYKTQSAESQQSSGSAKV